MTVQDMIRYYVSILVEIARADGFYDEAEIERLQGSTITFFGRQGLTVEPEVLVEILNEPSDWNESIEAVSTLDLRNRVKLFQQAAAMACADDVVTLQEDVLVTVIFASIFSEEEQLLVSQFLDLKAQLAVVETAMYGGFQQGEG